MDDNAPPTVVCSSHNVDGRPLPPDWRTSVNDTYTQPMDEEDRPVTWPAVYKITVKGRLDGEQWSQWLDGIRVTAHPGGVTVIRGPVTDQATLYGLLARLRDLALPLLALSRSPVTGTSIASTGGQAHTHHGR